MIEMPVSEVFFVAKTITLYDESDRERTSRALRKGWIALLCALIPTLAGLVALMILRQKYPAIIVTVVGAWICYYIIMNKMMPWFRYRRFLRDMDEGLSRVTDGWFVSLSESPRMADGVSVHDFVLRVGDEEEDERLFLWDDDKALPEINEGEPIHVVSFSNFVKKLSCETVHIE